MKDQITRDQFVAVLEAAGIDASRRAAFHREFERQQPAAHDRFLAWLGLPAGEAARVPEHARAAKCYFPREPAAPCCRRARLFPR